MKLYGYWRSTSTWRVRIGLQLKRLDYEYAPVNLLEGEQHREEYRALSPGGTVPLLETDEDGRTVRLAQSMAILEYLEERHPDPPLLPEHPYLRARARMLAECVNSGIQPLQNLIVLQHVDSVLKGDKKAWAQHWIDQGLRALQGMAEETAGSFLVGERPTVADVYLVPQLNAARRFGVDLSPFGLLLRVEEACNRLSAFETAHADNQPDAVRH
jgi:maleylpyruvate isomerase